MKSNRVVYRWLVLLVIVGIICIGIAVLWQNKLEQPTPQVNTDKSNFSPHTVVLEREPISEQSVLQQRNQSFVHPSDSGKEQSSQSTPLVTASVADNKADENPTRIVKAETRDAWLVGAVEVERREIPETEDGKLRRIRVLKTSMKYPLVRVEEEVKVDPDTRQETVLKRVGMCADHVIVKLKPGMNEAQLQAIIDKYGGKIRAHKKLSNIYLVELSDVTVDSVPRAVEIYKKEMDTIAYAEPDYVVTAQDIVPNTVQFKAVGEYSDSVQ